MYLRGKLFPILEYPMYAPAHYEGERVSASWLIDGILANGRVITISNDDLHVDIFDFVRIVHSVLDGEPTGITTLQELIQSRLSAAADIRQIRIKSYPLQVTRDGPVAMPSEVLMTIPMRPRS
jgi:hypothetical protein